MQSKHHYSWETIRWGLSRVVRGEMAAHDESHICMYMKMYRIGMGRVAASFRVANRQQI